jgi:hypothetical protein
MVFVYRTTYLLGLSVVSTTCYARVLDSVYRKFPRVFFVPVKYGHELSRNWAFAEFEGVLGLEPWGDDQARSFQTCTLNSIVPH